MIIVTGGAGFIGSAIVWKLNQQGFTDIVIVDELGLEEKWKNLAGLSFSDFINKNDFISKIKSNYNFNAASIIHMGANSATTEKDADFLINNNFEYTKELALYSVKNNTRFVYASSAATYGDGALGFDDDESKIHLLRPLNMYGYSKSLFDLWALNKGLFNKISGVKFFNVYGPNEYHKGDMRSVVHKAFEQISSTGKVCLFRSQNYLYKDGEQLRDFVYVKDAVNMTLFFLERPDICGLFNVGTGNARTWKDLVTAIFNALDIKINIEFIDLPEAIASKYQYFTEANLTKIKKAGYALPISSIEDGITDYVKNYLLKNKYFGY